MAGKRKKGEDGWHNKSQTSDENDRVRSNMTIVASTTIILFNYYYYCHQAVGAASAGQASFVRGGDRRVLGGLLQGQLTKEEEN